VATAPPVGLASTRERALRLPSVAWLTLATLFTVAGVVGGVLVGPSAGFGIADTLRELVSHIPGLGVGSHLTELQASVLWEIRMPRVVLALVVGSALAGAGSAYQGVFRNPLADPYLLGVAAGAGLGATLAIVSGGGSSDIIPLAAFGGAGLAVFATLALGRSLGGNSGLATLILSGVTVAAFATAVQTFVQQQHTELVREVYSWLLGRLTVAGWGDVVRILPYVLLSLVVILAHRRLLDALALGDDEASSLGIDVRRVRGIVIAAATLCTAAAVSASGLIGFVGIIVPHAVRLVCGGGYRRIVPLSIVVGGGFLVVADILARTALSPGEIPIGVVTAFFGAPFFAVILRSAARGRV
jgi:iron complex transport system permease protein